MFLFLFFIISVINSQDCLGGELRSKESFTYGRFEVRMKSAQGNGYVSSFFTYHDFWSTSYNGDWQNYINEIDIEFTGNLDHSIQFTTHHPGPWSQTQILPLNYNPHQEYHDYAFEWTPNSVKWFVNNVEIYNQNQSIVDDLVYPQKIMMNLWSAIYQDWVGEWNPETMPVNSFYDYVKYYAYTEGSGNYGTDNNFTLLWEDHFNAMNENRWEEATHGFDGNYCQFDPLNVLFHNGKMILFATDSQYILGDVNNDMALNITDVVSIVNMILDFSEIVNIADYNQDNMLNVVDLIFIIDVILNQ